MSAQTQVAARAFSRGKEVHRGNTRAGAEARPVGIIPSGVWQAARSLGEYSLVGCTVSPGFEFSGFKFTADLPDHGAHFVGEMSHYTALL